jgi:2-iminobutanoate/2-iminopropanoate deaminase
MENIKAILEDSGYSKQDFVKASVYATSIEDFTKINEIYSECFNEVFPARVFVEVSALALGFSVEIDAIAYKK